MTFTLSNKGRIKFDVSAIETMQSYRQVKKEDLEAGGVLLGRFIVDSKNIVMDKVSTPMIGDKRTRYSFARGAKMHQRFIDKEWEQSNGTCHYLGEWHTHPEKFPEPSGKDLSNWITHLKRDAFSSRFLYFAIVGIEEICVWEGDRRTFKIKKIEAI
jgi:integrative and conjugative element protein (TIGR02256 family)